MRFHELKGKFDLSYKAAEPKLSLLAASDNAAATYWKDIAEQIKMNLDSNQEDLWFCTVSVWHMFLLEIENFLPRTNEEVYDS